MSLARNEIAEQPAVLDRLLKAEGAAIQDAAAEIVRRRPRYVVIAARGSSDNAARYAQHVLGRFCGLTVALASPSLHTLYDAPLRYVDALVIGISQSGSSPDIVTVVEEARRQGAITIAITNDPKSPMARAAARTIALHAGAEESVAATKTYTASLGAIAALAAAICGEASLTGELHTMPKALERQIAVSADGIHAAVAAADGWQRLAVVGRGANYGTAFEAALKIKELAGVAAEPYSPADFMHGPIAVVGPGFPVLSIAAPGPALGVMQELADAVRTRGGALTVIGEGGLELVETPEWLSPLVAVVPAQLLAVGLAERLGIDVDRPFGLSKITRTT